jgi:hypothetical protein
MDSISEVRDYIIVFGTILITIFILLTTILSCIVFLRVKNLLNYINNSISEIDAVKNKIVDAVPKPFQNIVNGALSIKTIVDSLARRNKITKKRYSKSKKNTSSKGGRNV